MLHEFVLGRTTNLQKKRSFIPELRLRSPVAAFRGEQRCNHTALSRNCRRDLLTSSDFLIACVTSRWRIDSLNWCRTLATINTNRHINKSTERSNFQIFDVMDDSRASLRVGRINHEMATR